MTVPPVSHRREIDTKLVEFFRTHRVAAFKRALSSICRYYHVKMPRIEWYEYIDWGRTAGKTYEDGRIHLIHPENWKRGRVYKSERMWVQIFYHEMGHYLFWTDAERKANTFQRKMVRGLRNGVAGHARKLAGVARTGLLSRRRAAARRRQRLMAATAAARQRRRV